MSEGIDKLHADAVCALGLYLHGNEKTDRAKALRVHEAAVDALAAGAAERIRERDATIAGLSNALSVVADANAEIRGVCRAAEGEETTTAVRRALAERASLIVGVTAGGADYARHVLMDMLDAGAQEIANANGHTAEDIAAHVRFVIEQRGAEIERCRGSLESVMKAAETWIAGTNLDTLRRSGGLALYDAVKAARTAS